MHHGAQGYHKPGYFKDDVCKLGFVNNVELYFHCLGGVETRGKASIGICHRDRILDQFEVYANVVTSRIVFNTLPWT
jgi:hypothetical protein